MKQILITKVQAMPASFFNLIGAFILLAVVSFFQLTLSYIIYSDRNMSLSDNLKRVNLVKQVVRSPQSIEIMSDHEITVLLKTPSLKRNELHVTAWHYHGESCSLDIYFSNDNNRPDYAEYRALSMNAGVSAQFEQADQSSLHAYCIKDVLEAQGVNTPDNYARQPTPTWENPYRT